MNWKKILHPLHQRCTVPTNALIFWGPHNVQSLSPTIPAKVWNCHRLDNNFTCQWIRKISGVVRNQKATPYVEFTPISQQMLTSGDNTLPLSDMCAVLIQGTYGQFQHWPFCVTVDQQRVCRKREEMPGKWWLGHNYLFKWLQTIWNESECQASRKETWVSSTKRERSWKVGKTRENGEACLCFLPWCDFTFSLIPFLDPGESAMSSLDLQYHHSERYTDALMIKYVYF